MNAPCVPSKRTLTPDPLHCIRQGPGAYGLPVKGTPSTNSHEQFWFHASHRAGDFHITHKSYSSAFSQGWHEHDRGSIDFVLAGGGVGTYAHEEIRSAGGQVEYFAPEVRHRFSSDAAGIRTLHISFPGDVPRTLGIDPNLLAAPLPHAGALAPAVAILKEVLTTPQPDLLLLESLSMRLLEDLARTGRAEARGAAWIEEVRSLLIEEPELATSLGAIARLVGRHPAHVSRQFRLACSMTVGEFGRRVRLSRSARELASGRGGSIARIAHAHGFFDQAHYTNAFRGFVGCTPTQFVRRLGHTPESDTPRPPR